MFCYWTWREGNGYGAVECGSVWREGRESTAKNSTQRKKKSRACFYGSMGRPNLKDDDVCSASWPRLTASIRRVKLTIFRFYLMRFSMTNKWADGLSSKVDKKKQRCTAEKCDGHDCCDCPPPFPWRRLYFHLHTGISRIHPSSTLITTVKILPDFTYICQTNPHWWPVAKKAIDLNVFMLL